MRAFVVGTVVGGVAVWVWGDRARAYVNGRVRVVTDSLIHLLDATTDTLEGWRTELEHLGRTGIAAGERRPVAREHRDVSRVATGAAVK
jgi:hypothetical protein